jgi:hypothetical protein
VFSPVCGESVAEETRGHGNVAHVRGCPSSEVGNDVEKAHAELFVYPGAALVDRRRGFTNMTVCIHATVCIRWKSTTLFRNKPLTRLTTRD